MAAKDSPFSTKTTLKIQGKLIDLGHPRVMGILNITPDSFFSSSRYQTVDAAISRAWEMIDCGATFIDVGGYSSRPGAVDIDVSEEMRRVIPVIEELSKNFPDTVLSIDTFRGEVANAALNAGANMVNDISGGDQDSNMIDVIESHNCPYVVMHMRGNPKTMEKLTDYKDVTLEIMDYFQKKVHELVRRGISDVIVDPGFGFAKTRDQNYELLRNLDYFKALGLPVLVGLSRKSMITQTLEVSSTGALNGTTVLNTLALVHGARILRVHDVKEAVEAVNLFLAYNGAG